MAERKSYAKPPGSRGQTRPMAFGQGQSRSTSYSTEDGVSAGFDGQRDRTRGGPLSKSQESSMPPRAPATAAATTVWTDKYPSQQEISAGDHRIRVNPTCRLTQLHRRSLTLLSILRTTSQLPSRFQQL
jgi:hypothetical protein